MVITGKLDGSDCYQVNIDQKKAAETAVEHLIAYGHTKIALIGGRRDVNSTYTKRVTYRSCLRKHGIEFSADDIVETPEYSIECGLQVMDRIFDSGQPLPTAVIAINDFMAMGIMQSIRRHGLGIPDDISILSFDDTFIAESETPCLTSVGYNYDKFAGALVETAILAIEGKNPPKMQLIPPSLVVRESTAKI